MLLGINIQTKCAHLYNHHKKKKIIYLTLTKLGNYEEIEL